MKLFNCFAAPGYHTSIITTFGVDFDAYESIALTRLREAGCSNNILVADARMLGHAMGDSFRRPKFAGRRYSVVGVQPSGVFHPKLILQLGKKAGRLLVASANMTSAGLAGNLEVVGEVKADEDDRQSVPVLRAAMVYLARFLSNTSVPRRQIEWAMKRTRWLAESAASDSAVEFQQSGLLAFLSSGAGQGIGSRYVDFVGDRRVKRLIAISPYWDSDLAALREFRRQLLPKKTAVVVQPRSALFPVHHWPVGSGADLFDVNRVNGAGASRFAHAKVFVAETSTADCVLFGSANCTVAALGDRGSAGMNDEVCLYRELEPGQAVKVLGLERALADSAVIEPSDLPSYKPGEDVPMGNLQRRLPGRFELSGDLLQWWPPAGLDVASAEVILLDSAGSRVAAKVGRVGAGVAPVAYQCEFREYPHFAVVRTAAFESSLAIILVEQAIQEAQRRSKSRAVKNALLLLDDEEAFEGLWVLDVIQKLEVAERELDAASEDSKPRGRSEEKASEGTSRKLTYEQFIAGRNATGTEAKRMASHLASSNQESVRGFLNALVGRRTAEVFDNVDEEEATRRDWSLGDETSDGEHALERDERFASDAQVTRTSVDANKQRLRRQQQYVKDTQASIATAVENFVESMREQATKRDLSVVDLLRLRAFLMVLLGAGSKKSDLLPKELGAVVSRRQVLPSSGHVSWKRLVGRLLFEFFRSAGKGPLIKKVVLDLESGEGLPADVLECWATCYWALCATRNFVNEKGEQTKVSDFEQHLAVDLYRYTRLLREELLGEFVEALFSGMSSRYGDRLGVDAQAVHAEHQRLVGQALSLQAGHGGER